MKFDVIIGNPPYQGVGKDSAQKLWKNFIIKSGELCKKNGYIGLVVPVSWTKALGPNASSTNKKINNICFNNSLLVSNLDTSNFFNVGVKTSYFIIKNDNKVNNQKFLILNTKFENIFQKIIKSEGYIPDFLKCDGNTNWKQGYPQLIEKKEGYDIPVLTGKKIRWTNVDDPLRIKSKIVFPRDFGYNVIPDFEGQYAVCQSSEMIITNNVAELFSFYNSKIIKSIMKECSWVPQIDYTLLRMLKIPTLTKVWTDKELYEYFNLNQEEIGLIESTIK